MKFEQGDILQIENIKGRFLVVSKNFFNTSEQAVLCPIVPDTFEDPLHIPADADGTDGLVMCEQMRLFDLKYRRWKKIGSIGFSKLIDITDAVQSIFDY